MTFAKPKALIGMVHVGALPGSPANETSIELIASQAAAEALLLADAGFDGILIENMHDAPYIHGDRHGPDVAAAMTRVGLEVLARVNLPIGVQILSGGNRHALAVANAIGGSFIRCENFVFSHVADEGLLAEAEAGPLLRYRRSINAETVAVLADIKKKHASHAITADLSLEEAVHAAEFFRADGVVITGVATGKPTDLADVRRAKSATRLPVIVGSGVTETTVAKTLELADAVIVGSAIKQDGTWRTPVCPKRAAALVRAAR